MARMFFLMLVILVPFISLPLHAFAAALPAPPCPPGLPGCGSASNVIVNSALPEIARILLNTTAGLSLLFVVIGGARYVLAFGRDDELTKAKMTIFWALLGFIVALMSGRIVKVVIDEGSVIAGSSSPILAFLQRAVQIITIPLNTLFLLMIVIGGMRMVYARGAEEEVTKGRSMVGYAILGVVIINAAPIVVKAFLNL